MLKLLASVTATLVCWLFFWLVLGEKPLSSASIMVSVGVPLGAGASVWKRTSGYEYVLTLTTVSVSCWLGAAISPIAAAGRVMPALLGGMLGSVLSVLWLANTREQTVPGKRMKDRPGGKGPRPVGPPVRPGPQNLPSATKKPASTGAQDSANG